MVRIESTQLFVGSEAHPRQLIEIEIRPQPDPIVVSLEGPAISTPEVLQLAAGETRGRVAISVTAAPGPAPAVAVVRSAAGAELGRTPVMVQVAEPGWTMHMISHFHHDPMWWNTQAAFTSEWDRLTWSGSPRSAFQADCFALVKAHLAHAEANPEYTFVLAEIDYLKPYWDSFPEDRELIRRLLAEGRLELVGGTYNEPNTNLTGTETTIRNITYGLGWQRDIMGGDPHTAWQLDVFGHDPQFPGLVADAGIDSTSWARGPYHQWGPMWISPGRPFTRPDGVQFPAEFDWIAPSGQRVLTHYQPAHYTAGWQIEDGTSLEEAEAIAFDLFDKLAPVAATKNILLPMGTDYSPPSRWLVELVRDWASKYVWPKFICSTPKRFFATVRAELAAAGRAPAPISRDMNPIFTGKDVSFIDTKQAHRYAEAALHDAEKLASFAALTGVAYPHERIDKAWRQLAFNTHHDGITGSESDQVYLDISSGWREAADLADEVRRSSLITLASSIAADGRSLVVANTLSFARTDVVAFRLEFAPGIMPTTITFADDSGTPAPCTIDALHTHDDGSLASVTGSFVATDVPAHGWRVYRVLDAGVDAPVAAPETVISNEYFTITVDPARGGAMTSILDRRTGKEILAAGGLGNELVLYDEYPNHPVSGEGPWHLVPSGAKRSSASRPAAVAHTKTALGDRLEVSGRFGPVGYRQTIDLHRGIDRIDLTTTVHGFTTTNSVLRVEFATDVPGAMPAYEVCDAVIGRGFAHPDVDVADHWWTLDNPAHRWAGLTSVARIRLVGSNAEALRAIAMAEVVVPDDDDTYSLAGDLVDALAHAGVTATTTLAAAPRCGNITLDSSLPDVRFVLGTPEDNQFLAEVLATADPAHIAHLTAATGPEGTVAWIPAARPLAEAWAPGADLRGPRDLPVVVVTGPDRAAIARLASAAATALERGELPIVVPDAVVESAAEPFEDYTVALLNRGTPSHGITADGRITMSVMRACTGWPSGLFIDQPTRYAPDNSAFEQSHWSHRFEYAVVAGPGDWRANRVTRRALSFNQPLLAALPTGGAPAPTQSTGSWFPVDPASTALIGSIHAHDLAIPSGHLPSGAVDSLALRVVDDDGRGGQVRLTSPVAARAVRTDITGATERDGLGDVSGPGREVELAIGAHEIATVRLGFDPVPEATSESRATASERIFSRYWVHDVGAAPSLNLPVGVRLEAEDVGDGADGLVRLTAKVFSDLVEAETGSYAVTFTLPAACGPAPTPIEVEVSAGGFGVATCEAKLAPDVAPGWYRFAASIVDAGREVEDCALVARGSVPDQHARPLAEFPNYGGIFGVTAPHLYPGTEVTVPLRVTNFHRTPVWGEIALITPFDAWSLVPEPHLRYEAGPGETVELPVTIRVPIDAQPGTYWILAKAMAAGRLWYTPSLPLAIEPRP